LVNSGSNSSIDPEWESQLVEYSLGVMGAAEAADFERSLNECRAHVLMARQYADLSGALGLAAVPAEPPEGHRARFMAKLAATPQQEVAGLAAAPAPQIVPVPGATDAPASVGVARTNGAPAAVVTDLEAYRERRRPTGAWQWVAVAAALVLLVSAGYGWFTAEQARNAIQLPPNWVAFRAQGTEANPEAWAVAFVNPDTNQIVVLTQELAPPSQAQQYELWWLPRDGSPPISARKFPVDEQGRERLEVTAPQDVAAFSGVAVSLEPVPDPDPSVPSGPVVMAGTYELP
jgi:anti-sigma-K factor RskA